MRPRQEAFDKVERKVDTICEISLVEKEAVDALQECPFDRLHLFDEAFNHRLLHPDFISDGGNGIGECSSPLKSASPAKDGVRRYDIDPPTEALLRDFFAVHNQRLFKLLGRTLPWPMPP